MVDADFRVVLVRHGETEWSRTHRHTGRTDVPLTPWGAEQAHASGRLLRGLDLTEPLVLTSPRQRAVRTAELAGLSGARVDENLAEWDYGDYEGITSHEIQKSVPDWTIFTGEVPGGESVDRVRARADRVLAAIEPALRTRDVILVGHGHFSRALISRWAGFDVREGRRFFLSTGAVSILGFDHGVHTVLGHNLIPTPDGAAP